MLSFVPFGPRARVAAAFIAAGGCAAASIAGIAACLTAPPGDIGTSLNERPEIDHPSVYPPEGLIREWPVDSVFVVPVRLADPTASCRWRDFDQDVELPPPPSELEDNACKVSLLDGGIVIQDVQIPQPLDGHCHIFTFIVAHGFIGGVPDSIGYDTARWEYEPEGALCNFYDAGAFQDGAYPPTDAGPEGLPVTPESGAGDTGTDQ